MHHCAVAKPDYGISGLFVHIPPLASLGMHVSYTDFSHAGQLSGKTGR